MMYAVTVSFTGVMSPPHFVHVSFKVVPGTLTTCVTSGGLLVSIADSLEVDDVDSLEVKDVDSLEMDDVDRDSLGCVGC